MQKIINLSNTYVQTITVASVKSADVTLTLSYYDTQTSWFYDLKYGDFKIEKQRLHLAYNILDRHKNVLPFGILVHSNDGGEPLFQSDFTEGRIELYLLSAEEAETIHDAQYRRYIDG